jgi:gliding motility-associated protein GldM
MAVKKRPVSPRQKMINLMYIVLLAMLALNVSNEVLKGFDLVGSSLLRTTENAAKENASIYADLAEQMKVNPTKVKPWYDKAQEVKRMSDSLYQLAEDLRWAIAREADGEEGNPNDIKNKEDLEAAGHIMLAPVRGQGRPLFDHINRFRDRILTMITDARQRSIIASNLSTEVPQNPNNIGKNWEEYMFEAMPSVAAVTMLTKLQSDIRNAEGEVLHTLVSNIDLKDIRVNELHAYVLPEATTLFPGETFRSQIFMAAVDTTQRPEVYVNGQRIEGDGAYSFQVGAPGEYSFSGFIKVPNAAGEIIQRDFFQKYNVIAPPSGATVAADLMNVLYAGFDNPVSLSASGVAANKISVTMAGGTLTPKGNGKYVARPEAVGKDVTFTVTGVVNGKTQTMGSVTFQVRKLPDPAAYIQIGNDRYKGGGRLTKAAILGAQTVGAAIDDGLLNIPFKVLSFEAVFHDRMGNVRPEVSKGDQFTEQQRELIRTMRRGQRFYISKVRVIGPDGIERTLPQALEVTIQ